MHGVISLSINAQNIGTQTFLLKSPLDSFGIGIVKKLRKFFGTGPKKLNAIFKIRVFKPDYMYLATTFYGSSPKLDSRSMHYVLCAKVAFLYPQVNPLVRPLVMWMSISIHTE